MNQQQGNKIQLLEKLQSFDSNVSANINQDNQNIRGIHHFDSYYEYILSLIGYAVGYGSFWRFPYLVYKNGGGVFLIPYFIAIFLLGMPTLYLETVTGQMHQASTPCIFAKINKGLKILVMTFLIIGFQISGNFNLVLTYSYRFVFSAFASPLPFANEKITQDTYFTKTVLNSSQSIQQFGQINIFLFILYIISIFICYLIVKNGVKTSGKIVIVTSLLPYALFIILAIRGIFLDGAIDGIKYLLVPDFSKLFALQIWIDAVVQVFYQMSLACGGIMSLSSLKPKSQTNIYGLYLIPLSIVACGFLCAFNIFMYIGHFCLLQNINMRDLVLSGPSLSFNIFPKALSILPFPNFWVFVFFITMVFLGIDTLFGFLQALFCYVKDQYKKHKNQITIMGRKISMSTAKIIIASCLLIYAPFLTSSAGIYYLQFIDNFTCTIPLSLGAVINYIFFVKIVSFEELERQNFKYTGEKTPAWIKKLLQGKIVISILVFNFALAFINQLFYFFKYSLKFYLIGWMLTLFPYLLAYIYYRYRQQKHFRTTFSQFNKLTKLQQ